MSILNFQLCSDCWVIISNYLPANSAESSLGLSIAFPIEKQRKIKNSGSDFLWLEGPSENNGILN